MIHDTKQDDVPGFPGTDLISFPDECIRDTRYCQVRS